MSKKSVWRCPSTTSRVALLFMDRRSLAATGLLAWAAALQVHVWYVTSTDEYKSSSIAKSGVADWTFRLPTSLGGRGGSEREGSSDSERDGGSHGA